MEGTGSSVVPVIRYSVGELGGDAAPGQELLDLLAVEEPLVLVAVPAEGAMVSLGLAMRTPGDDRALATGFLASEGIIRTADDIEFFVAGEKGCGRRAITRLSIYLAPSISLSAHSFAASSIRSSSCGLCGRTAVDQVMGRFSLISATAAVNTVSSDVLCGLPAALSDAQTVFHRTGGLHAAALFTKEGDLLSAFEDIGRHNAVDKVIGAALIDHVDLSDKIMMLSGRAGFELIQKAAAVGIPVVASIGAPSSLAVELAERANLTLAGFVRRTGFNLYSGRQRIACDTASTIHLVDT